MFVFSAKGSSRTYFPTQGVRGGYDSYPDDHRPVSTVLSGRRRARCDPGGGTGLGRDTFRQVRGKTFTNQPEFLCWLTSLMRSLLDSEPDSPEAAVYPEAGDCQQLARVWAGVHQWETVQVSVLQLHVSTNRSEYVNSTLKILCIILF